jgi:hypothetical protein
MRTNVVRRPLYFCTQVREAILLSRIYFPWKTSTQKGASGIALARPRCTTGQQSELRGLQLDRLV